MLQINVDISILMCLPSDSTFICTVDRRVAITMAYHRGCSITSDIIMLLVHRSVTENLSAGHSLRRSSDMLTVALWRRSQEEKSERALLVFDRVRSNLEQLLLLDTFFYMQEK